ncbi:MAG: hypothetical protein A2638_03230 [Nitrospirae bacterium RIFCSPHIGHO2_01_FULL_66_17]|nr:MAG: hypothetical protein A2638_03230 [Nitrospirae bacterium RIFCSPHIGHO2_01_FULL_66_17]
MTIWARLHVAVLAFWVGVILFFSGLLAPIAFQTFPQAQAGDLMNKLFVPYHVVGYVCGGAALLTAWFAGGLRGKVRNALLIALLGTTLYAGLVLSPEARTLRVELRQTDTATENPVTKARFDALHRRAVALNGAILIAALTALVWAVVSPPKRQK